MRLWPLFLCGRREATATPISSLVVYDMGNDLLSSATRRQRVTSHVSNSWRVRRGFLRSPQQARHTWRYLPWIWWQADSFNPLVCTERLFRAFGGEPYCSALGESGIRCKQLPSV